MSKVHSWFQELWEAQNQGYISLIADSLQGNLNNTQELFQLV